MMTDPAGEGRAEEIRRKFYTTFPNPEALSGETAVAIRDLLSYSDSLLVRLQAVEAELHAYRALGDVQWIRDRLGDIRAVEADIDAALTPPAPPST